MLPGTVVSIRLPQSFLATTSMLDLETLEHRLLWDTEVIDYLKQRNDDDESIRGQ